MKLALRVVLYIFHNPIAISLYVRLSSWPTFLNYLTEIPKHKRYNFQIILEKCMQDWSFAIGICILFEVLHVLNG